jgi:hypothetical protein
LPVADGAPPPDGTPPPDAAIPIDATPACDDIEPLVDQTGHHEPEYDRTSGGNQGCMGLCHKAEDSLGGPVFTAAGSLWDRRNEGGNPIAGAYVYVIDADGKLVPMMTAANGFFWTGESLQMPIRTYASGCPDAIPMEANTTGNCNAGSCHGPNEKIFLSDIDGL